VYVKKAGYDHAVLAGTSVLVESSAGWSLGAQVASEIIFFEDEAAYNKFTSGNFEFSAGAKVVAVKMGADDSSARTISTSSKSIDVTGSSSTVEGGYHHGMATFVALKKGVMVDVSVSGQNFSFKAV
jgi:lipid-binding SYLF domain-containing protein